MQEREKNRMMSGATRTRDQKDVPKRTKPKVKTSRGPRARASSPVQTKEKE